MEHFKSLRYLCLFVVFFIVRAQWIATVWQVGHLRSDPRLQVKVSKLETEGIYRDGWYEKRELVKPARGQRSNVTV